MRKWPKTLMISPNLILSSVSWATLMTTLAVLYNELTEKEMCGDHFTDGFAHYPGSTSKWTDAAR
jgi:hypothetical protein